jgi:hypothetical protein
MVDPWQKSKRRSSGSSGERSKRLKSYIFFLDENFDCHEVKTLLENKGVKYRLYSDVVPSNCGIDDTEFLPTVGRKGWILITSDVKQRYRTREKEDLKRFGVRHFALPGNLGAIGMAELLVSCKNKIQQFCREHEPPFSASINKQRRIELRMDIAGNLSGRRLTE